MFDTLHETMLGDDIPDETDWMAHKMVEIVRAGNANDEGLFAGHASRASRDAAGGGAGWVATTLGLRRCRDSGL